MRTKVLIAGAAIAAALWWQSTPAAKAASGKSEVWSRYLLINGQCWYEQFWDDNTTTRTLRDAGACSNVVGLINEDN